MDFPMVLEESSMMMAPSMKAALTMEWLVVTKLFLYAETAVFIEDRSEIIKLTEMDNCRLANFFIKESGTMIYHMAKHESFTTHTPFMKDNFTKE